MEPKETLHSQCPLSPHVHRRFFHFFHLTKSIPKAFQMVSVFNLKISLDQHLQYSSACMNWIPSKSLSYLLHTNHPESCQFHFLARRIQRTPVPFPESMLFLCNPGTSVLHHQTRPCLVSPTHWARIRCRQHDGLCIPHAFGLQAVLLGAPPRPATPRVPQL